MERTASTRRRGAVDIAMIGLMRDARLRVSEAADLTWGDIQRVRGGSGRVHVPGAGEADYREVSTDTMKRLWAVRRGAEDQEPVLGMRPNQIGRRIDAAARQAGLGEGYSGDSPRLGMIRDMETVGVHLLGGFVAESARLSGVPPPKLPSSAHGVCISRAVRPTSAPSSGYLRHFAPGRRQPLTIRQAPRKR